MSNKGWTQQIGEQDNVTFGKESPLIVTLDEKGDADVVSRAEVRKEHGVRPVSLHLYDENAEWLREHTIGSQASIVNGIIQAFRELLKQNNQTLRIENRVKR